MEGQGKLFYFTILIYLAAESQRRAAGRENKSRGMDRESPSGDTMQVTRHAESSVR
jgi:hypothetical protein